MISADVKADLKQQEIEQLVLYLVTFYKKYFENFKCSVTVENRLAFFI